MGICGSSNDKPGGTGTRRHDTGMGACHIKIEWAKDNFQEVEMELSLTVLHLKQRLPEVLDRCAAPHFESDVKQYLSDKPSFWEGLSVCNAGTGMLIPNDKVLGNLEDGGRSIFIKTKDWESFKADIRLRIESDPAYATNLGVLGTSFMPQQVVDLPGLGGIIYGQVPDDLPAGPWQVECPTETDFEVLAVVDVKDQAGDKAWWKVFVKCLKSSTVQDVRERAAFWLQETRGKQPVAFESVNLTQGFSGSGDVVLEAVVSRLADEWSDIAPEQQTMGEILDAYDWNDPDIQASMPTSKPTKLYKWVASDQRKCNGIEMPCVLLIATTDAKHGWAFWDQDADIIANATCARVSNIGELQ